MLNHLSRMSKFNYVFVAVKKFKTAPYSNSNSKIWRSGPLAFSTAAASSQLYTFTTSCAHIYTFTTCAQQRMRSAETQSALDLTGVPQFLNNDGQHFFQVKRSREKCSFLVVVLYFITWNVFKNNTILVDKLDKCVLLGKYTRQSRTPQRWRKVPVLDWKCFQHKRVIFTINSGFSSNNFYMWKYRPSHHL